MKKINMKYVLMLLVAIPSVVTLFFASHLFGIFAIPTMLIEALLYSKYQGSLPLLDKFLK